MEIIRNWVGHKFRDEWDERIKNSTRGCVTEIDLLPADRAGNGNATLHVSRGICSGANRFHVQKRESEDFLVCLMKD